jgi:hypothetical protein
MSQFFELLISGLSLGCIYALIAIDPHAGGVPRRHLA